ERSVHEQTTIDGLGGGWGLRCRADFCRAGDERGGEHRYLLPAQSLLRRLLAGEERLRPRSGPQRAPRENPPRDAHLSRPALELHEPEELLRHAGPDPR